MQLRGHVKQTTSLEKRLAAQALRLREKAKVLPRVSNGNVQTAKLGRPKQARTSMSGCSRPACERRHDGTTSISCAS